MALDTDKVSGSFDSVGCGDEVTTRLCKKALRQAGRSFVFLRLQCAHVICLFHFDSHELVEDFCYCRKTHGIAAQVWGDTGVDWFALFPIQPIVFVCAKKGSMAWPQAFLWSEIHSSTLSKWAVCPKYVSQCFVWYSGSLHPFVLLHVKGQLQNHVKIEVCQMTCLHWLEKFCSPLFTSGTNRFCGDDLFSVLKSCQKDSSWVILELGSLMWMFVERGDWMCVPVGLTHCMKDQNFVGVESVRKVKKSKNKVYWRRDQCCRSQ